MSGEAAARAGDVDSSAAAATAVDVAVEVASRLSVAVGRLNRRLVHSGRILGMTHLSALAYVVQHGSLRNRDLAQLDGVSAPVMSRTVDDLLARGLVSRRPDGSDGRAALVEPTPAGIDVIERARSERAELLVRLLDQLDARERGAVLAAIPALERLAEIATEDRRSWRE